IVQTHLVCVEEEVRDPGAGGADGPAAGRSQGKSLTGPDQASDLDAQGGQSRHKYSSCPTLRKPLARWRTGPAPWVCRLEMYVTSKPAASIQKASGNSHRKNSPEPVDRGASRIWQYLPYGRLKLTCTPPVPLLGFRLSLLSYCPYRRAHRWSRNITFLTL